MSGFNYQQRINNYPDDNEAYFLALELADLPKRVEPPAVVDQNELFYELNPQFLRENA